MSALQRPPEKKETEELVQVIDEYKTRLEQLIQKEKDRQRLLAEEKAEQIVAAAAEKAERIVADGQRKANQTAAETEEKARKDAARIVGDAKYKAEQVVREAEESMRKEAKDRTKREVGAIMKKAREEAGRTVDLARQQTEKDCNDLIAAAKAKTERAGNAVIEQARQEAYQQSARIMAEYRVETEKNAAAVAERTREIDALLNQSIIKAEAILNKFKKEVHGELEEMRKNIAESGGRLAAVLASDAGPAAGPARPQAAQETKSAAEQAPGKVGTVVDIRAARTNGGGGQFFKGEMELRVMPPYNSAQIKELIHAILQVPGIRRAGDYGSDEEGAKVIFEIREPLPLVKVLDKMPLVSSANDRGDSIRLLLSP